MFCDASDSKASAIGWSGPVCFEARIVLLDASYSLQDSTKSNQWKVEAGRDLLSQQRLGSSIYIPAAEECECGP